MRLSLFISQDVYFFFLQYENFIHNKTAQYRDSLVDFAERRKKNHEEAAELLSKYLQDLKA